VLHSIKLKKTTSFVCKLDLSKAYDRVSWTFIRLALIQLGMNLETVNWIMGCLDSPSFNFLINGVPSPYFRSCRGLKYGCLISPFLFLLVFKGLSLLIKKAHKEGNLKRIRVSKMEVLSHILFVDDVIVFGAGLRTEFQSFQNIIDIYYIGIRMQVNKEKSSIIINSLQEDALQLQGCLPFSQKQIDEGFEYLDFVLKLNDYVFRDWLWIYAKIKKRNTFWAH
jgi:hypothetical protein